MKQINKIMGLLLLMLISTSCDEYTNKTSKHDDNYKEEKYNELSSKEQNKDFSQIAQALLQQQKQLNNSIDNINKVLSEINNSYDSNDNKSNKNKIDKLADNLGELAKRAGEGARMLETATQILEKAIQEGFEEGYNTKNTETTP